MCGIVGEVGQGIGASLPLEHLNHRGPDASDTWTNYSNCILGHTRLSIIDLNTRSNQPMTDESGRYTLVFNGEIYNYVELSSQYLSNVQLTTTSDTEVLLQLWVNLGAKCLTLLRGMYSFSVWDNHENRLHLVRDRLGQKPLYYFQIDKKLVFASELNALAKLHPANQVSSIGVDLFLGNQFIPTPNTIYEGVYRLPAASYGEWYQGKLVITPYYELKFDHKVNLDLPQSDAIDILESKIIESVRLRLRSDVPVGSLLSGGVDSSLVTAIASRLYKNKMKTFSIGFEESEFSESDYARQISQRYNTEHHEHIFKEKDAIDLLDKSIGQYGEPFGDKSALASLLVCSIAGRSVPVVLSGDGGDELLGGYTKYRLDLRHKLLSLLPLNSNRYHHFANRLQYKYSPKTANSSSFLIKLIKYLEPLSGVTRFNEFFTPFHMNEFYNESFQHEIKSAREKHLSKLINRVDPGDHVLNKMLSIDHKNYFTDDLLVKMDIASMAYSLEVRSPLLDANVMEYAASLPIHMKQNNGTAKYLLKKIAESYLPYDLIHRKKQGFAIPVAKWLNGELRDPLHDAIFSKSNATWEYLNKDAFQRMYNEGKGITNNAQRFWVFLILSLWLRKRRK